MKTRHLTIIALLLCLIPLFRATAESRSAFPRQLDGTMMPYDFTATDTAVPWGPELKPVFINYVARHGARFLSSEHKVAALRKELAEAAAKGTLTPRGEAFMKLIAEVERATADKWGALNATGIMEEVNLGKEMAMTCPQLLKEGRVRAEATYVPRVVMTMYEFCHELARYSDRLEITTSEGRQNDRLLRFFTTDTAYITYLDKGPWLTAYVNFFRKTVPAGPAAGMVRGITDTHRLQKMTMDAYGILQSLAAAGIEADPSRWFTEDEYRLCWEAANLKHYYQRSESPFSRMPAISARPLLKALLENTDSVVESRKRLRLAETVGGKKDPAIPLRAALYFGHAETVIPLFSLMRLPDCYAPLCNPDDVAKRWKDWQVAPLGANLMVVCLEDSAGRPFAAMRLNGKWIETGGQRVTGWPELRGIWENLLKK